MHTSLNSPSSRTKEDTMSMSQPSLQCSHKDCLHSLLMHVWISTIQIASTNGRWQPRGITKYTSKNKPSKARIGRANPLLLRTSKEMVLGRGSGGQTEERGWDAHQPNQPKSTQTPWTQAQWSEKQQLRQRNRSTVMKDDALSAPRGGTLPESAPASKVMQKP